MKDQIIRMSQTITLLHKKRDNLYTELQHVLADIEEIKKLSEGHELLLKAITGRQRQIEKVLEDN